MQIHRIHTVLPISCIPSALPEPHPGSAAVCGTDALTGHSLSWQTRCIHLSELPRPRTVQGPETDLRVFVRVERRDTDSGRTEGLAAQTLFLIRIKQNMVRHQILGTVRYQNMWHRNTLEIPGFPALLPETGCLMPHHCR